ncbi:unnamed protein product [Lathyrus oleraceus]
MFCQLEHELELPVPASEAWDLFGTLRIWEVVEEEVPELLKVEIIEGDGEVGTILKLTFTPDVPGPGGYKEKITKIDNEKRIKEVEVVEWEFLDFIGLTLFRVRSEVREKGEDSSVIKSTMEYEVKEVASASIISIRGLARIVEACKNYLNRNKATKEAK